MIVTMIVPGIIIFLGLVLAVACIWRRARLAAAMKEVGAETSVSSTASELVDRHAAGPSAEDSSPRSEDMDLEVEVSLESEDIWDLTNEPKQLQAAAAAMSMSMSSKPRKATPRAHDRSEFRVGQEVHVLGLITRPDLNTALGEVTTPCNARGGYDVRIRSSNEEIELRPANLRAAGTTAF
jgi:hypothetical protein